ncbi:hypothetical protein ENUP19_0012G0031 [Entamoeba nuttalli]|uniref:Uncharacterized protein n=2 Tax=Entamoeba nuttalli TaxID=412467 RepID=K2GZ35_ENTNP|nr:hypothetical protein ENU1_140910 [Entamoeba nuttalli P19]EKE39127.1 hypothetical protein ENU1_140910 [Entamoeba nuttalli P19]|eukprot:XP_008858539.1 hypothetical protein ENU1_140910 [Entamoeba nuttalli P19]
MLMLKEIISACQIENERERKTNEERDKNEKELEMKYQVIVKEINDIQQRIKEVESTYELLTQQEKSLMDRMNETQEKEKEVVEIIRRQEGVIKRRKENEAAMRLLEREIEVISKDIIEAKKERQDIDKEIMEMNKQADIKREVLSLREKYEKVKPNDSILEIVKDKEKRKERIEQEIKNLEEKYSQDMNVSKQKIKELEERKPALIEQRNELNRKMATPDFGKQNNDDDLLF